MTNIRSAIIRSVMSSLSTQLPHNIPDLLVPPRLISAQRPIQKQGGLTALTLSQTACHCLHTQFITTYPTYNSVIIVSPSTVIQFHEEQTTECKENKECEHTMITPQAEY